MFKKRRDFLRAVFAQIVKKKLFSARVADWHVTKDVKKYGVYVIWSWSRYSTFLMGPLVLLDNKERWRAAQVATTVWSSFGKDAAYLIAVAVGELRPAPPVKVKNKILARVAALYASGAGCVANGTVLEECDFEQLYSDAKQLYLREFYYRDPGALIYAASKSYIFAAKNIYLDA